VKRHIFPVALISLVTPFCFADLRIPSSTRPSFASASQPPRQDANSEQVPDSCPVTKPPSHPFVPPSPYPTQIGPGQFWFGANKLWTQLPANGTWKGLPHSPPTDTAFMQKLFWWREGYVVRNHERPMLKIILERLDPPAAPFQVDAHANAAWTNERDQNHPFIVAGIDIPTLGCWKITGSFEDAKLTYVVWVTQ
jgi:hypothetical protein